MVKRCRKRLSGVWSCTKVLPTDRKRLETQNKKKPVFYGFLPCKQAKMREIKLNLSHLLLRFTRICVSIYSAFTERNQLSVAIP